MADSIMSAATLPTAMLQTATQPKPTKIEDAAKQFEGLMIGQMLKSARESGNADGDSEGAAMYDMADQEFSKMLANNGGMGLAHMIVKGLQKAEHDAKPAK